MKIIKLIIGVLLLIAVGVSSISYAGTPNNLDYPKIIEIAEQVLPHEGALMSNGRGFIYLKVDDAYIYDLFPLLHETGYAIPPYFRRHNSPGAHISVFYEEETKHLPPIEELGKRFTFQIDRLVSVQAGRDKSYIILQVKSPELEALREQYGLRPKLQGHEFHITIATKQIRKHVSK